MNQKELKLFPFRSAAFLTHFGQSPQPHHDRSVRFTTCDPSCAFYIASADEQHCQPIAMLAKFAKALTHLEERRDHREHETKDSS